MDYSLYSAEDFAADESFISYHLRNNPGAIAFWEEWISLHPEKMDEIMIAERLLDKLLMRLPEEEFEAEQARIWAHIAPDTQPSYSIPAPHNKLPVAHTRKKIPVIAWIMIPAILAISAFLVYKGLQPTPINWQSYQTPAGKKATIVLDDGSKVILNAGATLQYHPWQKGDSMRLRLQGEAFFEVAPQAARIFVVNAGELDITVLGTSFNVQNLPEAHTHSVALVTGKIKLHTPQGDTLLQPQQLASYSNSNHNLQLTTFDTETITGWKDGIIKWQKASFNEVAAALHKVYHIVLVNQSGTIPAPFTGRFVNSGYESIIKSYCYTHRLSYLQKGNTITLQNK